MCSLRASIKALSEVPKSVCRRWLTSRARACLGKRSVEHNQNTLSGDFVMPNAFDSKEKALAFLTSKGGANARWVVRLAVEQSGARHSLTNVYANGQYVGSFQLSVLGPAFYYDPKPGGYQESDNVHLSWGQINDGLIMTYKTVFPWGPWICHDYSGYLFKTWGIQISNSSPTSSGFLYGSARVLGVFLWPGTGAAMAVHKGWNGAQDGARATKRAASQGWQKLQSSFSNATRPGGWRW
jgi:hypothetical protein